MRPKIKTYIALALPLQIIVVKIMASYPDFIERYYANGIYPVVASVFKGILGWIPFSIGDIAYLVLIAWLIRWLWKNFKGFYKTPKTTFLNVATFLSIAFFCFHFIWGMNYHRSPLDQSLQLKTEYDTTALIATTKRLIEKSNSIHFSITQNDTIKVTVPYDRTEIFNKSLNGYLAMGKDFPQLKLESVSLKKSLISLPLTYMGFGGYLNPFTLESQVNYLIPKHRYPYVSCHELAHQLGYAAENEANFIGSLAAMYNEDIYFKYSGTIFATRSCLRDLYRRDHDQFERLKASLNKGILKNFKESNEFWDAYENPIEPLFKNSYDAYLKANNQNKGIQSYSYVVALLVNFNAHNSCY